MNLHENLQENAGRSKKTLFLQSHYHKTYFNKRFGSDKIKDTRVADLKLYHILCEFSLVKMLTQSCHTCSWKRIHPLEN